MSWLFAAIGTSISPQLMKLFSSIHAPSIYHTSNDSLYIAVGGLADTIRCSLESSSLSSDAGYAVVGTGMATDESSCHFLSAREWSEILRKAQRNLPTLDGHFAAMRWTKNTLEAWTDHIGLRTLYAATLNDGVVVSTRLDWVAKASGCADIDFDQIGSSWLMTNQMAYGSQVKGIVRLGPGGWLHCTPTSLRTSCMEWTPEVQEDPAAAMISRLRSILQPQLEPPKVVSLGMSGGFDCRLLLALMRQSGTPFLLHSFGHPADPDVLMAKRIAIGEHLPHTEFTSTPDDVSSFIALLREYVSQVGIIAPASLLWKVRHYPALHQQQRVLIDGGYGEISRRQMGNRLLRKGAALLRRGNPDDLLPLVRTRRASIFRHEVEQQMLAMAKRELQAAWQSMPAIDEIGVENFVDLFSLRTRVPNSGSPAQQWIDSHIVNYMPYTQPSFLREVFRTPLKERRNARLHRRVIRQVAPTLTRYPLTKEGVIYPYVLTTLPAWLWRMGAAFLRKRWIDDSSHRFLHFIKEFVQDTVHSNEVKDFGAYDYERIRRNVERYYAGEVDSGREVDWWLTFELWRTSLRL